jgi:hypothetical protein
MYNLWLTVYSIILAYNQQVATVTYIMEIGQYIMYI